MTRRHSPSRRRRWGIRKVFLVVGALALAALAVVLLRPGTPAPETAAETSGAVGLVALNPTVDLGRVPFDRQAVGRFELVNRSDRPVRIVEAPTVRTVDGC
ncbi:MAG: hypothetical protein HYY04_05770 [Chloroflexi bacterium]|nr:hypothetical protein [Chloroflexota bacterium]